MRVSAEDTHQAKEREFRMMQRVAALNVPICTPLEFGICEEGVYSLQSWIDGVELEEALPEMSEERQYFYGEKAGRYLKRMHKIPAPRDLPAWEVRFNDKIDRKLRAYEECPLSYEGGEAFVEYLQSNRHALHGRPQCFQHGDYHAGNMMLDEKGKLFVIDFNRWDYGDPWEEFNRIVWSAQVAPAFAGGMVDGYFDKKIPDDFWRLLALYIASNTLGSLPWALSFGKREIDVMQKQAAQVLEWYDGMTGIIPAWYENR
jgi:aminoglycoside phosphotransferase (APT) family kinase protein